MKIKKKSFITSNTLHKQPHRTLYLWLEALTFKRPGVGSLPYMSQEQEKEEQARAELGQAQLKMGLIELEFDFV